MFLKLELMFAAQTFLWRLNLCNDSQNKLEVVVYVYNGLMLRRDIWVPKDGTCDFLITSDLLSNTITLMAERFTMYTGSYVYCFIMCVT